MSLTVINDNYVNFYFFYSIQGRGKNQFFAFYIFEGDGGMEPAQLVHIYFTTHAVKIVWLNKEPPFFIN